ncbi:MAG: hypothetical protein HZB33_01965 [Nitrospirae bacterium]|nr:hypothetical protein [Nitrospirota bacterium]
MEEITKEKALEIAAKHLAKQIPGRLSFCERPAGAYIQGNSDDYYCIFVESLSPCVGAGQYVFVSKVSGKVAFAGLLDE